VSCTFRALTTIVRVEIDEDMPYAELARALIEPYPRTLEPPELHYHLRAGAFSRSGVPDKTAEDPRDLVPLFEMDLYEQVIERAAPGWLLHASAIEVAGSAIVLAGPSGAGKTTMALALASRGHRMLTEEVVWIDANARTCGLSRALHVRDRANLPASWRALDYPLRPRSPASVDQLLVVPATDVFAHGTYPLRAIVRLTHGPDRRGGLEPLAAHDAITRLWDVTLRQDEPALAAATTVLRSCAAYRLASTSFGGALRDIEPLLDAPK
jgi:hypothetical protein